MSLTLAEQLCAATHAALAAGMPGTTVSRRREDAYAPDELPAIEVTTGEWSAEPHARGVELGTLSVRLTFVVAGSPPAEAALSAMHMAAHTVLAQSAAIAALGGRLRFADATEPDYDDGVPDAARLTATYQLQTLFPAADLSRPYRSTP